VAVRAAALCGIARGSVRQCSIVRGRVRQQCAAVYSAYGSVWQQSAAVYSVYGSVRQCAQQCVVVRDSVCFVCIHKLYLCLNILG
jgi:hypothetical protein